MNRKDLANRTIRILNPATVSQSVCEFLQENVLEDDIASGDINSVNATMAGIKKNANERNSILKARY